MSEEVLIAGSLLAIFAVGVSLSAARQRDIAQRAASANDVTLLGGTTPYNGPASSDPALTGDGATTA